VKESEGPNESLCFARASFGFDSRRKSRVGRVGRAAKSPGDVRLNDLLWKPFEDDLEVLLMPREFFHFSVFKGRGSHFQVILNGERNGSISELSWPFKVAPHVFALGL